MDKISALYTIRPYNPMSILIRAANPVSVFKISPASHVLIVDGDYLIEANMEHGVRRVESSVALKGLEIVHSADYEVPDAESGLAVLRAIAARNAKYDFKGAVGLALAPDRNWQEDSDWFCSELFAYGLHKSGRPVFANDARVTPYMCMCVSPRFA